jgi:2-polyprenyl-3-methyl-5-hydroxy-6-metoxy-1,4-benzoquinol methylase
MNKPDRRINQKQIRDLFFARNLNQEAIEYLQYHAGRYEILLDTTKQLRKTFKQETIRILDIGPSFFTEILYKHFTTDIISMMGLDTTNEYGGGHLPPAVDIYTEKIKHYVYNLNNCQFKEKWLTVPVKFDIIILAEVIEHLTISPVPVLKFIKSILNKGGYLIIQTPNAVSLDKRIAMLRGFNPFEIVRETDSNPGHVREYTINELTGISAHAGITLTGFKSFNYPQYKTKTIKGHILNLFMNLCKTVFGNFRDGFSIILRNM